MNKSESNSKKKMPRYDPDLPTPLEAYLFSRNPLTRLTFLIL
jgi:hypothetical protein